jgi:ubiquinone/menaquinone biosynthesis C-methylase UbiE
MPTMHEIYKDHPEKYNKLVDYEDYERNLEKEILKITPLQSKVICELGMGTGRLTKVLAQHHPGRIYGYEREPAMLNSAKARLREFTNIEYTILDNTCLEKINQTFDLVIEGWSIGHTILDHWDNRIALLDKIMTDIDKILNKHGTIIFIETLGSCVDQPEPPGDNLKELYTLFETRHGLKREIIRTDYQFPSNEHAQEAFGCFFGDWIVESVKSCQSNIIKEFTGVWHKQR